MEQDCVTCGNHFTGRFCNICGEKIMEQDEKSVKTFLGSVVNALTFADSKLLRTLVTLVAKPGEISASYSKGRRLPFIKPISMFFVANLIYFLFPFFQTFNLELKYQMQTSPYGELVTQVVERRMSEQSLAFEAVAQAYDTHSVNVAKLMLIELVLLMALFLSWVNYSKNKYFGDHLLAAFEIMNFFLFVNTIFASFALRGLFYWFGSTNLIVNYITPVFLIATSLFMLMGIQRRMYDERRWSAIGKTLLLLLLSLASIVIYRFTLFFVTLWTM